MVENITNALVEQIKAIEKLKTSCISDQEYHTLLYNILIKHESKNDRIATTYTEANSGFASLIKIIVKELTLNNAVPERYKKYYTYICATIDLINVVNSSKNKEINAELLLNGEVYKEITTRIWKNYSNVKVSSTLQTIHPMMLKNL